LDISAILTDRATTATQSAKDEIQMCLDFNWIKQMKHFFMPENASFQG
jgi:hypothetical protein